MTPQEFVRKWWPVALTERQTAQEHFAELCRLLSEPTPIEADPEGIDYAYEKGANRAGERGWAHVWKRGCFAMEYNPRHANLGASKLLPLHGRVRAAGSRNSRRSLTQIDNLGGLSIIFPVRLFFYESVRE
jgi:hypothetical protein